MIITLKTHEGNEVVQVRSMSDGLNYQVFTKPDGITKNGKLYNKKGKEIHAEWVFSKIYAQSLEWALYHAIQLFWLESDEEDAVTITSNSVKDLRKLIDKAIKKIVVEVDHE